MKTRLFLILPILFEAISEALELKGYKVWGKQVEVLELISWFTVIYYFGIEIYKSNLIKLRSDVFSLYVNYQKGMFKRLLGWILIYFLLRFVFFNYILN